MSQSLRILLMIYQFINMYLNTSLTQLETRVILIFIQLSITQIAYYFNCPNIINHKYMLFILNFSNWPSQLYHKFSTLFRCLHKNVTVFYDSIFQTLLNSSFLSSFILLNIKFIIYANIRTMNNQSESLLAASGRYSLSLIKESSYLKAYVQFWQTWTNFEISIFLYQNPLLPSQLQNEAANKALYEWTKFNQNDFSGSPSYVKNANIFENRNFWDPKNENIIWDDRIWLGNAYAKMYKVFKAQKYLKVAIQLFQFVVKHNWQLTNYQGVQWKPKKQYRNTITNSLFLVLCGRLYEATGDIKYLNCAKAQYDFLFCKQNTFCLGVKEGVFPDCISSGAGGFYTYNQGMPLEGLLYLIAFHNENNQYIQKAIKLINNTIQFFKHKSNKKYICIEFSEGDYAFLRTSAIFRSFLFRSFVYMKRLISPQIFNYIVSHTPLLKIFILDNAQAMCKFQNLKPCKRWQFCDDNMVHQYNSFNQFYVLLSAHQLYGIQEIMIDGVGYRGDGSVTLEMGEDIKACYISQIGVDEQRGVYVKQRMRPIQAGWHRFRNIIEQQLNERDNNTTYFQLQVIYANGVQTVYTIVHMQADCSKFAVIPDKTAEYIANNFISRIRVFDQEGVTYESSTRRQISISCINKKINIPLRLIIH